jgi:hypothetical protein
MRIVASLILIAAIAIVAWFFKDSWRSRQAPSIPISSTSVPVLEKSTPKTSAVESTLASAEKIKDTANVEQQAKKYVAKLTAADPTPIRVENADNFVTKDQLFSLIPKSASQKTTIAEIIKDKSLAADTPITIVKKIEQVQRISPEKLIASSAGNLDTPIKQLVNNEVKKTTVRKVLEQAGKSPDKPIDIVTEVEYFEQTTIAELSTELKNDDSIKADTVINVITKPHGLEAASMGDLIRTQTKESSSSSTSTESKTTEDGLFYVRTVRPGDSHGIWGIVQEGIIKNFARGMAIRRGLEINTYQVEIPKEADEKISGDSSSFLGRLIFRKSNESYVFNYQNNRMCRNPDQIHPGQEIVIINFKPDELISIYKHFVDQRG